MSEQKPQRREFWIAQSKNNYESSQIVFATDKEISNAVPKLKNKDWEYFKVREVGTDIPIELVRDFLDKLDKSDLNEMHFLIDEFKKATGIKLT